MTNLGPLSVRQSSTLKETIRAIDKGAVEIALIVDEDGRLLGVATDGDIRRALLKNVNFETPVQTFMNRSPLTVHSRMGKEEAIQLMVRHQIKHLPVLDAAGRVTELMLLEELVRPEDTDNLVVIMAGGLGQRLRPLTASVPKPMLMVGHKPILEIIIEQLARCGLRNIVVALNHKAEVIEGYFQDGKNFGVRIRYVHEQEQLGTAGALTLLDEPIKKPFLVMNGDLLTRINFQTLLESHSASGHPMTVCVKRHGFQVPYGVVDLDGGCVTALSEKPTKEVFINAGIYVLDPAVVPLIQPRKYSDMTDVVTLLLSRGEKVGSFPIMEYWLDIGQLFDYQRAVLENMAFSSEELLKFPQLGPK